jgi:hypothetical protein
MKIYDVFVLAVALLLVACEPDVTARTSSTIYVSNVAANGLPVGTLSGDGSMTSPYLTVDQGYAAISSTSAGTVYLNADPADTHKYTSADTSGLLIAKSLTLAKYGSGAARIQATSGQSSVLEINPRPIGSAGGTVNLVGLTLDANGTARQAILTSYQSTAYALSVDSSTTLSNPTAYGIYGEDSNNLNLSFSGNFSNITSGSFVSAIYFPKFAGGNIQIAPGSIPATITGYMGSIGIFTDIEGTSSIASPTCPAPSAAQPSLTINGVNVAGVVGTGAAGTNFYLIHVSGVNCATVENSTLSMTTPSNNSECRVIVFDYKSTYSMYYGSISNNNVTHDCFDSTSGTAGDHIEIGTEGPAGTSPPYQYPIYNTVVSTNTLNEASATSASAAVVEPLLVGWVKNTTAEYNVCNYTAWCVLFKGTAGTSLATHNTANSLPATNATANSGMDQKAGTGSWVENYVSASPTSNGAICIKIEPYTQKPLPNINAQNVTILQNKCVMEGVSKNTFIYFTDAYQTLANNCNYQMINTFCINKNTYIYGSAPLYSAAWQYDGSFYNLCSAWQAAIEPNAACNSP